MIIIITIVVLFGILFLCIIYENKTKLRDECLTEYDCVSATCCHATSCVSKFKAQNCTDVLCTDNCLPGTLDCGQAKCGCDNGKCVVVEK